MTFTTLRKKKNKTSSNFPSYFKESTYKTRESRPSPLNALNDLNRKCFKCLGYGHIASNCPFKRNMMMHDGVVLSDHSSQRSNKSSNTSRSTSENESEIPCEGDLLVVRRMLGQV